ncbi:putative JNK1/MAPK8-associated membrane protein [Apostichopus japonicus]|uniref:Putative JNK1/MAPK8-associated membrane protein n=1 Tax=Stichopus japonicus TaxID=307972 RepID=A0A2G8LR10_STIJA|nr:putative JNK1/MAPK8-associated membrane protein [Apostichopus japonicus]
MNSRYYLNQPDPFGPMSSSLFQEGQKTCPGLYCGRTVLSSEGGEANYSACGACPRGYQPNSESLCTECSDDMRLYDWLYLGFMCLIPLMLNFFFTEMFAKKANVILLHVSSILESIIAAVLALLVVDPKGRMNLNTCRVKRLSDWYTMFKNPQPSYSVTLHCTQEAVFPLFSVVLIYYAFNLALMMVVRPMLSYKFCKNLGRSSIYAALYFHPILVVFHAVFSGLVYFSFPYVVTAASLTTHAVHFAFQGIQKPMQLLTKKRSLVILLLHWLVHAFSIVAITEFRKPLRDSLLFLLLPVPAMFYLLTAKFTDPSEQT